MTFLFFGDSFTAGVELLDYQFYNDYPAPMSYEDKKSQHMENWRKNNKPLRQIKTKEEIDQIWEKQKLIEGIDWRAPERVWRPMAAG